MIERINKIKSHRIFHNFTWGKDLINFGKCNLIYGRNGSGKSTLSNLFRAIEKRIVINEGDVEFIISGNKVSSYDLSVIPNTPQVRVFNKEFITENLFTSHGSVSPIFFLGEVNIVKQKQIECLKELLAKNSTAENEKRCEKANSEKTLESFKSDRAKTIKTLLSSSGTNTYNSYDKRAFQAKCDKLLQLAETELSKYVLTDMEQDKLKREKDATVKNKLNPLSLTYPNMEDIVEQVNLILQHSLVSSSLEILKNDLWLAEWTRSGHLKHKERNSSDCLFCGQVLPMGCLEAMESHFNNEYKQFISKINEMSTSIQTWIDRFRGFSFPNKFELYDHLALDYETKILEFTSDLNTAISFLERLNQSLKEKSKNPFQAMNPLSFQSCGREELLWDLNYIINKHNKKTDGFQASINEARSKIEQSIIAESVAEFRSKSDCVSQLSKTIERMSAENANLTKQIFELEKDIGSHRKPADELNTDICAFFGRPELTFETKENGYQIYRNGTIAHNLSEGEKTAIGLLYFLKTLGDKSFSLKDGIVVIDDPIASLDSTALSLAFDMIKEHTKMADQLFIMTHNHSFFMRVKDWFNDINKPNEKDSAHFYMLSDNADTNPRSTSISMLDPSLSEYPNLPGLMGKEDSRHIINQMPELINE